MYEVENLKTGECRVSFTLKDAREIARGKTHYAIWEGELDELDDGGFYGNRRVELCDPYEGDDDRVKQALGQSDSVR
jgi:hypothetical protein